MKINKIAQKNRQKMFKQYQLKAKVQENLKKAVQEITFNKQITLNLTLRKCEKPHEF